MLEVEWSNLKAHELEQLQGRGAIVIVPIGSIEQHGPHLPVQVDALLAGEVARRAARLLTERQLVVVAPTVWNGLAEHHMALGGTITLDFQTFFALLRCICGSMVRHGFRRLLLLNGHGGNITALNVVVGELTREFDAIIVTCSYWHVASQAFGDILERQSNVMHAGEVETSMVLALKPELVDTERLGEASGKFAPELLDPTRIYRWRSFAELTETGVMGEAATATAAKGERLLDAAGEAIAAALTEPKLWGEAA